MYDRLENVPHQFSNGFDGAREKGRILSEPWTVLWSPLILGHCFSFFYPPARALPRTKLILCSQCKLNHCFKNQISPIRKWNLAGRGQPKENMTKGENRKVVKLTWDCMTFMYVFFDPLVLSSTVWSTLWDLHSLLGLHKKPDYFQSASVWCY